MINILGAIISGLLISLLAEFFYPGSATMGWIATFGLGVGGAVLASLLGGGGHRDFQRGGCLASILGAIALILVGRFIGWR